MLDWEGKRHFLTFSEPKELVDAVLDVLSFTPDQRAAVERQAALHAASSPPSPEPPKTGEPQVWDCNR
jgi:hypothetical protein